ncbi:MAG: hypothetical protein RBG13Loki_0458 [Promethearchaeota archaeon CR_4]|nr:MAG: hypothetical protein RBG13Loki_0458 [Candidatus Lokiarchaeota archaeon CR_4]
MGDFSIEDTCILLDASRSMMRRDFKPSRLVVALKTIKKFVEQKIAIDPKDRTCLATYGSKTQKICDFTNDPATMIESFRNIEISGQGEIEEGFAFAIQQLVKEIRKIGGKVPRIFVVTDERRIDMGDRMDKIGKLAKGLGIFIDVAQIGNPKKETYLKQLSHLTSGEYAYFNNEKALGNAGTGYASKKQSQGESYVAKIEKKPPPLVSEVAVELRKPNLGELKDLMRGIKIEKCQICYQEKCPKCSAHFFSCGRYCPSCGRPIHMHCATMWAQKSPETAENVFRCPNCYFLLRVPKSVVKLMNQNAEPVTNNTPAQEKTTKMMRVPDATIANIDESCGGCHNIFTKDQPVFRCQACGVHYHEKCLEEMYKTIHACRSCGMKIV